MKKTVKNVLFVDDEPFILKGYERSTEEYEGDWSVFFATSGREALDLMTQTPIDVIVTDMRMPGMDGKELLEQVSRQHPGIVRFVLSGNAENLMGLQFTNLAHQFLTKPCDLEILKKSIDQIFNMRQLLDNPQLTQLINGIRKLPSPPLLYNKLMKEIQSENSTSKAIGDIISQDMALTAKILQIANSAFIGMSNKIADPQRAVTVLGINTIKALVLSIHVFAEAESDSMPAISVEKLWRHSILVGSIAREIASESAKGQQFQNDAQIIGLMHDIGKLLQLRLPDFAARLRAFTRDLTLDEEYEIFGTSHAEMGAYLLGIWGLPIEFVEATAFHHTPAKLPGRDFNLGALVHIANGLYYMHTSSQPGNYHDHLDIQFLEQAGLSRDLDKWADIAFELIEKQNRGSETEGE
jgi:HD-like signal output (HDOD) protein/ActR/RegA family two-component response regulator